MSWGFTVKIDKTIKDFLNYFFSDLFVKGFLFISLPLLSRVMVPEEYGKLSLINSSIAILFVFMSFNTQNAFSNRYMHSTYGFGSYLYSNLLLLIPFQFILLLLSPLYLPYLSPWLGLTTDDLYWVLIICSLLSIFYIYTSYLQAARLSKEFAFLNVFGKVSEIALIFVFAIFMVENQYLSKIYAQLIVVVVSFLFILPRVYRLLDFKFSTEYVKDALFFSLPLIPHVLANSLLSQVDRFLINSKIDAAAAGIYSFAYNLGMAIVVVIMAWNSSWQPKLYQLIRDGNERSIKKVSNSISIIILYFSMILIFFSREVVVIFASKDYYDSINIIPIIVIGNALIHIYITYANFAFYAKKTFFISIATIIALIVNVSMNILLIPIFGIEGAAWATVFSYILLCICHFYSSKYIIKLNMLSIRLFGYFLSSLFCFYFIYSFISQEMPYAEEVLIKIILVIGSGVALFKFRERLKFV